MSSRWLSNVLLVMLGVFLGIIASQNVPVLQAQDETKGPRWLHAHELRVRKAGEADFTKDTKKYSLEVFRDENNGNLIYISETGDISVVAGAK